MALDVVGDVFGGLVSLSNNVIMVGLIPWCARLVGLLGSHLRNRGPD